MSSNLPPGVTDSMLPGNTPEDHKAEAFADWLWDVVYSHIGVGYDTLPDDKADAFEQAMYEAFGKQWSDGYAQGGADAELARTFEDRPAIDDEPLLYVDICAADGLPVSTCKGDACKAHGRCCWQ